MSGLAAVLDRLEVRLAAERADLEAGRWPTPTGERDCRTNIRLLARQIGSLRISAEAHELGLCGCHRPDDPCCR